MRQAGVLAAAGLIALEQGTERLSEDHENARTLAGRLAEIPGIAVDAAAVRTNIVIFGVGQTGLTGAQFSGELKGRGVLANSVGPDRIRFVTHRDVGRRECEEAADIVATVAAAPVHSFHSRVDKN
jgi:threonine aldolase